MIGGVPGGGPLEGGHRAVGRQSAGQLADPLTEVSLTSLTACLVAVELGPGLGDTAFPVVHVDLPAHAEHLRTAAWMPPRGSGPHAAVPAARRVRRACGYLPPPPSWRGKYLPDWPRI